MSGHDFSSGRVVVLACGHLQLRSKAGNLFPAFLLNVGGTVCVWKVKKDFLCLQRCYGQTFPKKAYAKLSEAAQINGPWVVPDAPLGIVSSWLPEGCCPLPGNYDRRMKKSLYLLECFVKNCEYEAMKADTTAWHSFCKPDQSQHLLVPLLQLTVDSEPCGLNQARPKPCSLNPARLGQYFASDANSSLVASKVMELVTARAEDDTFDCPMVRPTVFVEPSCGDGRIVSKVLPLLKARDIVICYDIDQNVINKAKETIRDDRVVLRCTNYLDSNRRTLENDAGMPDFKCIVFGGPPYRQDDDFDPCVQFVAHSIEELKADFVVFILPIRCKKLADGLRESMNNNVSKCWDYDNFPLQDMEFHFQDTKVTQPSFLQVWRRGGPRQKLVVNE
mmetsp:Transcript_9812/g.22327  ORF Transcript_9812/g.22327 Transcript_9812/m.22327 type:complete len:390 (-) Transcript_9812:19-1188(-)